jgi:hypothetical protein
MSRMKKAWPAFGIADCAQRKAGIGLAERVNRSRIA